MALMMKVLMTASILSAAPLRVDYMTDTLPWKDTNLLLPKYSYFELIDVETGKTFQVQRRAGNKHADVQPVTEADTKVMKEIYGGHWSWNRRAILVKSGSLLIPASMNGMPHGGGALQNGFPGHFCVHFLGSTTHKTPRPDFAHTLMIHKAAGELPEFLASLKPEGAMRVVEMAVKQRDEELLGNMLMEGKGRDSEILLEKVRTMKISSFEVKETSPFLARVEIKVKWTDGKRGVHHSDVVINLHQPEGISGWKIGGEELSGSF
ncbi:hypothetical protein [Rossellomorea marisflavi]|uniref:hypothetical protein n=1 Tax=Rossellomorea marisflavi TaxID=189381 RepID=UPI003F5295EB